MHGRLMAYWPLPFTDATPLGKSPPGTSRKRNTSTVTLPVCIRVHRSGPRMSGDGTRVFGLDTRCIQTWSTSNGTSADVISFGQSSHSYSPSFVVGGSRVWVHSENSPTHGWDLRSPSSPPLPLTDMPSDGCCLDFIQVDDTNRLNTGRTRIEGTITRKEVFRLPERFAQPGVVQWDERYLVAAYSGTGELLIMDSTHTIPQ